MEPEQAGFLKKHPEELRVQAPHFELRDGQTQAQGFAHRNCTVMVE